MYLSYTCILRQWRGSSCVLPEKCFYLYSTAMAWIFPCFVQISYYALCPSLLCLCTMQIDYDTARIPWCLIPSCILVPLTRGYCIFFLDSCCSSVLRHSLLLSRCDCMALLLIYTSTHLILCGFRTPRILCSHALP